MSNQVMKTISGNEQQRLLNAIWRDEVSDIATQSFDAQGINIYRRNLFANALRALTITFPTVFELMDSDISERLAQHFLQSSPPTQGDWAQWGSAFAEFIAATAVGQDIPYLADCAALDWHVHCALHGKDQTLNQASLQLLGTGEPEHIVIEFNQNVKLLRTFNPVVEIFYAHHHEDEIQREMALDNAKQALASVPANHMVMVYRPEFQPQVMRLTAAEGVFMLSLLAGGTLAQSLDLVASDNNFSFEKWLMTAIKHNLIYQFKEK